MIGRVAQRTKQTLQQRLSRNKIEFDSGNPYNKRWQWKWRQAYFTSEPLHEPTRVGTPEQGNGDKPTFIYSSLIHDWTRRIIPGLNMAWNRRHRMMDPFSIYAAPAFFWLNYTFSDVNFGFMLNALLISGMMYTRIRDKTMDPDMKEAYLREMIYHHPEIKELFDDRTIHVLDYNFEYDKGFPDEKEFPEFKNKLFRFFNTDTSMCTGYFVFGDVESGATMTLNFKTMPVAGKFRFQVGEPYFFYDMVAHINHNGQYKEVVIVDREKTLKRYRPFLMMF